MLADLGLDPPSGAAVDRGSGARLDSIDRYRQAADPDEQAFLAVWEDIMAVVEAVEAFVDVAGAGVHGIGQGDRCASSSRSRPPSTCGCATRPSTSVPACSA